MLCLQSATPATPSIPPAKRTKAAVQDGAQAATGLVYADGSSAADSVRLDPEKLKEVVMYAELAQAGSSAPLVALQLMGSFSHTGESKTFTACFP